MPRTHFHIFLITQFLASLLLIFLYQTQFDYKPALIPNHLLLIFILHIGLFFIGILLIGIKRIRSNKKWSILFALLYGIPFYSLLLIYLMSFVSKNLWGVNATLKMAIDYLSDLPNLIAALPFYAGYLYAALILPPIIILILFYFLRNIIYDGFKSYYQVGLQFNKNPIKNPKTGILLAIMAILITLLAWQARPLKRHIHKLGDPLINTILGPVNFEYHFDDPARVNEALKDKHLEDNYKPVENFRKANIILIMIDALRPDFLPVYGHPDPTTPFLDSLNDAGKIQKVETALATCPDSYCAIISMLASREWQLLGLDNFGIHDVLKKHGYTINFLLSGSHLEWYNLHDAYGRNVDYYHDGYLTKEYGINDDRLILEGLDSVPSYSGNANFFYFHLMSAHAAGFKQKEYEIFTPTKSKLDIRLLLKGEYDAQILKNNYKNGIRQADAIIEGIFYDLGSKGYMDDAIVVILGDHGEAFGEHGHFGHVFELWQENLAIPMLLFESDSSSTNNLAFATQLDIAPTLLDKIGIPIPESWQGKSLISPPKTRTTFHQSTFPLKKSYAFIDRDEEKLSKFIFREKQNEYHYYNLQNDPKELNNLFDSLSTDSQQKMIEKISSHFRIELD